MLNSIKKWKNSEKIYIVCLGDSITANNACTDNCFNYVNLLAKKLGNEAMVVNAGVSGDTAYGMLNRLDREVLIFKPDLVTVMLGINDPAFGSDIEDFKRYTNEIARNVLTSGSELVFITQNTLLYQIQDNVERRGNYPEYIDAVRQIAKENCVNVCDAYSAFEAYAGTDVDAKYLGVYWPLMFDYLHPNSKGHQLIADELFKTLKLDDC